MALSPMNIPPTGSVVIRRQAAGLSFPLYLHYELPRPGIAARWYWVSLRGLASIFVDAQEAIDTLTFLGVPASEIAPDKIWFEYEPMPPTTTLP